MADYPVTLSSNRKSVLTDVNRINGFSHKFTITNSELAVASATATADTVTVTLGALPASYAVVAATANITTAVAGTTALTMVVGTTTSTNAFITSQSVLTAGRLVGALSQAAISTATASKSMVAVFTNATGGSPSAITAGSIDIYLNIQENTPAFLG